MLKFALCDDEPTDLKSTVALIKNYAEQQGGLQISFSCFKSAGELLENIEDTFYHAFFLDIRLPILNGLRIGEIIRKRDKKAAIIYLSNYPEYALPAYEVEAFHYLTKPVDKKKFYMMLDRLIKKLESEKNDVYLVKTSKGIYPLKFSNILAVEYHSHFLTYYLLDGTTLNSIVTRTPFQELEKPYLITGRFLKISRSVLINPLNVERVDRTYFYLKTGIRFLISRSYSESRKKFARYLLEGINDNV